MILRDNGRKKWMYGLEIVEKSQGALTISHHRQTAHNMKLW